LGILIKDLKKKHERELLKKLNDWLDSDSNNLRWFAAEVIGYLKIKEVKDQLPNFYKSLDKNAPWEHWQLNCLWAHSRFQNYQELNSLLNKTKSEANRLWILDAYSQMVRGNADAEEVSNILRYTKAYTEKLKSLTGISESEKAATIKVLEENQYFRRN
jgi:hypothetical protein